MKVVIQRVLDATVRVAGTPRARIGRGLLVYLGVAREDSPRDAEKLAEKITHLRIFADQEGKMNRSIRDLPPTSSDPPAILVVSQFTLLADTRKGRRPYYGDAAPPDQARALYEHFIGYIRNQGLPCQTGVFQAHMELRYTNDGPVTIIIDSRELQDFVD
ncbi:MAG: D-tyrosyl-tRNA(Tyr) deacylase [Treponema sp.]|jgi:D-tyrosyl-tRNA(Tyr) deacylase|nr:D-tyrosyl-tRNA(Tyr) deacylase [Treponema sp.]